MRGTRQSTSSRILHARIFAATATLLLLPALGAPTAFRRRRKAPIRELYDTSVGSFAPDGSIHQVEYAAEAVKKGGLVVGVVADDGVALAAHIRKHSPLLKTSSISKFSVIDDHAVCAVAGLMPDGRLLVDQARSYAVSHWFEFDEPASVTAIAAHVGIVAAKFHRYYDRRGRTNIILELPGEKQTDGEEDGREDSLALARPLGVSALLAGADPYEGPTLLQVDPSGAHVRWRARAVGSGDVVAESFLNAKFPRQGVRSVKEAMLLAVAAMRKALLPDELDASQVEMMVVTGRKSEPKVGEASKKCGASGGGESTLSDSAELPREGDRADGSGGKSIDSGIGGEEDISSASAAGGGVEGQDGVLDRRRVAEPALGAVSLLRRSEERADEVVDTSEPEARLRFPLVEKPPPLYRRVGREEIEALLQEAAAQ